MEVVSHGQQKAFWEHRRDGVVVYVGGMGSGKTFATVVKTIIYMMDNPGIPVLFIEPTYKHIKDIAWVEFERVLDDLGLSYRLNRSDNVLSIPSLKGRVLFRSGEHPDRIIGFEVGAAFLDEFALLKEEVFTRAVQRVRSKGAKYHQIVCAGTPEGAGSWAHKLADAETTIALYTKTTDNPHLPATYIDQMASHLSDEEKAAYLEGKWVAMGGNVYHAFDRTMIGPLDDPWAHKVEAWCDFNVGKMAWLLVANLGNGRFHVFDEFVRNNTDTERHGQELIDEVVAPALWNKYRRTMRRGEIDCIVDASAKNRNTRASAGKTDTTILQMLGFRTLHPRSNPPILDSVQSVNYALRHGLLTVSPGCKHTIETLERQGKDDNGMPDKRTGLDHAGDCLRYGIHYHTPIKNPRAVHQWQGV